MSDEIDVPADVEFPYDFDYEGTEIIVKRKSPIWIHERIDENRTGEGKISMHNLCTSLYHACFQAKGDDDLPHGNLEDVSFGYYTFVKKFLNRHMIEPIIEPHPDVPVGETLPIQFTMHGVELELIEPNPAWVQKQKDRSSRTLEWLEACHENLIVPIGEGESTRPSLDQSWEYYTYINTLLGRYVVGPLLGA